MKKKLISLAATAALAVPAMGQNIASPATLAAPVTPQSSVTLYGIADAGFVRSSNIAGTSRLGLDSGYLQSSRFGFRGNEDLGGGLRALFTLENGFNVDTGAAASSTVFFNRQAFVGIASNSLGTLTAGRQYTPGYDNLILLAGAPAFGVSGGAVDGVGVPGSTIARFDNTLGGTRIDNSVKYTSPTVSGFRGNAMLGFGEVAGASSAGRLASLGAAYNNGPLSVGTSYLTRNCTGTAGCTATQANNKVFALGAGYDFGPAKLAAIYTNEKNGKLVKNSNADVFHVMVQVPVGALLLSAGLQRLNDKSTLNEDVTQFNLSAVYALSKRTSLYGAYSNQKVDNGGKASMALGTSSNGRQNIAAIGMRHVF